MAENMTKQSSEEEALRKLLMGEQAGEGGGEREDPLPVPVPPADSPSQPEESHPAFALYKECMGLVKGLPKPVQDAFAKLVKSNQPVWPGGKLSDDKKREVALGLGHKRSRLEQLKVTLLHLMEIAKQRDDYQKQVEEAKEAEVQPPIRQLTPPASTKSTTSAEPEWDALPLWAKWTIGGVGSAVILGVIAWVCYAVVSM